MNLYDIMDITNEFIFGIINSWIFLVMIAAMIVFYKNKKFNVLSFVMIAVLSSFFFIFYNSMTGDGMGASLSRVGYPENQNRGFF